MQGRIDIRDNKVYAVFTSEDWNEPRYIHNFYLCNVDADLVSNGGIVTEWNGMYFYRSEYKDIPLFSAKDHPVFSEFTAIKPPKKTGYRWVNGEWRK